MRRCAVLAWAFLLCAAYAAAAGYDRGDLEYYLFLAEASQLAYEDAPDGLVETPSGCVALLLQNGDGDVAVAFRGSVVGDRQKRHPFSSLGGRAVRQTYRDWAATNLKQATGFLPRQYLEAAELVAKQAAELSVDKRLYVTGHSKGGGAAEFAAVAAHLNPDLSAAQKKRIHCVTFNAAVVAATNWKRLQRQYPRSDMEAVRRLLGEPGKLVAVSVAGDPVSRFGADEQPAFGTRLAIPPHEDMPALQRHDIATVISEITLLLDGGSE